MAACLHTLSFLCVTLSSPHFTRLVGKDKVRVGVRAGHLLVIIVKKMSDDLCHHGNNDKHLINVVK